MNILVGFNHTVAFDRRAFVGVASVANERGDVRLIERLSNVPWPDVVRTSQADGLIVARLYGASRPELRKLDLPFVLVCDDADLQENEYIVGTDETAIGVIAARHFLDAGYQQFAVCSRPGLYFGFKARIEGFINEVRSAGWSCQIGPETPAKTNLENDFEDETIWAGDAAEWIAGLPKPLAVFAPYDYHARVVVNVAQQAGLRVPDDVAVIGVDDDDVYCMTTYPQLSSVITPAREIGQVALATLLRVIGGEKNVPKRTLIPPPGVMIRGSSSDFAVQDPDVSAAVRYIRDHIAKGVSVEQVAQHVLLSRRTLERRFLSTLSHTIQDEMRRAKVRTAKRLLIDTDMPYAEVARRSGMVQQQQLNRLVKLLTGQTPAQIRAEARKLRPT